MNVCGRNTKPSEFKSTADVLFLIFKIILNFLTDNRSGSNVHSSLYHQIRKLTVNETPLTSLPGAVPSSLTYLLGQSQQQCSTANIQGSYFGRGNQ